MNLLIRFVHAYSRWYSGYRALVSGAMTGFVIFGLAILADSWRSPLSCFWFDLPLILIMPVAGLVNSGPFQQINLVIIPTVLALIYALLFWCIVSIVRSVRHYPRTSAAILAPICILLVLAYVHTWIVGVPSLRQHIRQEITQKYHFSGVSEIRLGYLKDPEIDIYYCVAVLPFVIACKHQAYFGALDGYGLGLLWFWDLSGFQALWLCEYQYWMI